MEKKVEDVLKHFVDNGEIAGAVIMVRKAGEIVEDFAYGYGDLEKKTPVNKKTMFSIIQAGISPHLVEKILPLFSI